MLLTAALITNAQQESLHVLSTNVRVFAFTLEELKQKMTLVANTLSNRLSTEQEIGSPIREFGVSGVTVLDAGGEVVYTLGTDLQLGTSLSADPVVVHAFTGASRAALHAQEGPEFPAMMVRAGSPMVKDGKVSGAVIVDFPVDTVFLDRVKELTGLEIVLFGGIKLSATTLRDESGRPRIIGAEDEFVQNILQAENGYNGSATLGHERFLIAGLPVENIVGERIGALAVGISESELLKSLDEATQRTLLGSALLIVLSLLPLYGVAHVIAKYQHS
ncbi:MAG: cache domain-containing protein [bacterium]|nr:cache domain-containing protein [bacterium]